MSPVPHDSWAEVYDMAYEESFGTFYTRLTEATLEWVGDRVSPDARIIDFGAGTGRLTLPLAARGYAVTAVEPSAAMLRQLEAKCRASKSSHVYPVRTVRAKMQDPLPSGKHDLALCVFTVVLYLTDAESLASAMRTARRALRPGGLLLLDIPSSDLFQSYTRVTERMHRQVIVRGKGAGLFDYEESLHVCLPDGEWIDYEDRFPIRCWQPEAVLDAAAKAGLAHLEDVSSSFVGSGSSYHLFQAPSPSP